MGMECGKAFSVIVIWDSGKIQKHMVMEFINGKMGIDMKEAGIIVLNMGKDLIFLPTVIHIQEITNKENQTAKASTNGKMEAYTKEVLKTA